jgi:hypothetical protein
VFACVTHHHGKRHLVHSVRVGHISHRRNFSLQAYASNCLLLAIQKPAMRNCRWVPDQQLAPMV